MDKQAMEIMEKTAAYIEKTQSELDKHSEMRDSFLKRAHQVAGVLANKGLIGPDVVNTLVDKIAADESGIEVWNLVEKLTNLIRTDDLGTVAKVASSGKKLDAFERLYYFGDANADTRESGMVD